MHFIQQKIFVEYIVLDKVNDEEPHAHQLGKLLETSQVLVAKEGETVEPGFKIAIISKSGEGVAHVAPLEKIPERAASQPSLAEKIEEEKPNLKLKRHSSWISSLKHPLCHLLSALQLSPSFHLRIGIDGFL
ncbi:uncharacterized protein LOC123204387 [Mangifera indica]|uniref:uncharacterized protein LOC123204387 n=1 Tax=Mangifera indica TaxID=29780 RepID=UPI001CFB1555|nr:uncharacterized protein LOC123204387 [Mangifera indica]